MERDIQVFVISPRLEIQTFQHIALNCIHIKKILNQQQSIFETEKYFLQKAYTSFLKKGTSLRDFRMQKR